MSEYNIVCKQCRKDFTSTYPKKRFCSIACKNVWKKEDYRKNNPLRRINLKSGEMGALSEMIVCADLLAEGWSVYRAISGTAPFDLVAFKGDKLIKVEVTTGTYGSKGALAYPPKDNSRFNLLAVVTSKKIHYFPEQF